MLFVRFCLDRPDTAALRAQNRQDHHAYLRSGAANLVMAGPLSDGQGGEIGSCYLVEAQDALEVPRFHDADPFTRAGIYQTVHIVHWDKRLG